MIGRTAITIGRTNSPLASGAVFDNGEKFIGFRGCLLSAMLMTEFWFGVMFLMFDWIGISHCERWQILATRFDCGVTLCLWGGLRRHERLRVLVSVLFVATHLSSTAFAFIFVGNSELRVVWFLVSPMLGYILLGRRAGAIVTLAAVAIVLIANRTCAEPLSNVAMTTVLFSLGASSAISYIYARHVAALIEHLSTTNLRLRELANNDPLTGLLNPRAYHEVADRMIRFAQRKGAPFAALFIDLDHFKAINDAFGHEAGDVALRAVAECLAKHMRHSDVLGRIGGEEFAAFLPGTTLEGALALGEKLRREVERLEPRAANGVRFNITASVGVSNDHPSDRSIADIQRRADRAMYQAKSLGRNRVVTVATC